MGHDSSSHDPLHNETASRMGVESVRCSCGVALESRLGQAYNEEAFRYFLAIERKRAERSRRSILLLLIDMKKQPGMSGRIPPVVAARIFSAFVARGPGGGLHRLVP